MNTSQHGFTLIELIVVLAIAIILLTMAAPAYSDFVAENRQASTVNGLLAAMVFTRSEAVKRGGRVTLCKSSDESACTTTGGWEQGWIVFVDVNNDAVRALVEPVLRVGANTDGEVKIHGNNPVKKYVSYTADGSAKTLGGGYQMGSIIVCDRRGYDYARSLVLSATGRVRVVAAQDSSIVNCDGSTT